MTRWRTIQEFESELLRDDDFRRDFAELEPEYQIARTILSARKAIGMSQQTLARTIGTSQGRISKWERAEEVPRLDALKRIANATGISFKIGIDPSEEQVTTRRRARSKRTVRSGGAKRSAARRKTVARKATARKSAARKATSRRKTVARKTTSRKSSARKAARRR